MGLIACLLGICGLLTGGLAVEFVLWMRKPGKAAKARVPQSTPAPQPLHPWQVTVLTGPEAGKRFLPGMFARLGSAPQNEIQLNDPLVAPYQAQIQQTPQGCLVSDLGSPGGTFVNGVRIQSPVLLNQGDRLKLGNTTLQIIMLPGQQPGNF